MISLPQEPSAKDPISATFMKALMRCIRANTLLNGTGYRTKRGPNGTTLEIDKPKPGVSAAKIPGCFEIVYENNGDVSSAKFENRYFMIGGRIYECPVASFSGGLPGNSIICLEIDRSGSSPLGRIFVFQTISEMKQAETDDYVYYVPLYKTDENGAVSCDMRTIPSASAWEDLT